MLSNSDWEFILNTIEEEQGACVLLIGREMCVTKQCDSFENALIDFLDIHNDENILKFYEGDGLFLFRDGMSKTKSFYKIRDFYKMGLNDENYKKISRIPFHLIISTSPDHTLKDTFDQDNILHQFSVYNKTENPEQIQKPRKDYPLLYNLLGSIYDEESLILTHDDVFEYMQGVFGTRPIPANILETLLKAKNLIFVGFKFEKWYVQLLLRLLGIHEKDRSRFARYALNKSIVPETQSLVMEQFRISFIDNNIDEFINELYTRCEKKGILRQKKSHGSIHELIENYIESDEMEKAFDSLKSHIAQFDYEDLKEDMLLLSSKYNRLIRRQNLGSIDERDAGVENAKIKESLLSINKELASMV